MKVSDVNDIVSGKISWKKFCEEHKSEKARFLARRDGILTSADLQLTYDVQGVLVRRARLIDLCEAAFVHLIKLTDVGFVANAILLSGCPFESEELEDCCHDLSLVKDLRELSKIVDLIL